MIGIQFEKPYHKIYPYHQHHHLSLNSCFNLYLKYVRVHHTFYRMNKNGILHMVLELRTVQDWAVLPSQVSNKVANKNCLLITNKMWQLDREYTILANR